VPSILNSSITSAAVVKKFSTRFWIDDDATADELIAPEIGTLSVTGDKKNGMPGDFQADVHAAGGLAATLKTVKIAGSLTGAHWKLTGTPALAVGGDAGTDAAPVAIESPAFKSITINGDSDSLGLSLTQAFDPNNARLSNLPKLTIKGVVDELALTSAGNVGKVTTGDMTGSRILIGADQGITGLPAASDDFTAPAGLVGASLASLKVTGNFASSVVAATTIGSVDLPAPDTANGGVAFGIATRALKKAKIQSLATPDGDDDGSVDPAVNGDFNLRIV
jgi:hypothetical protein